jgi:hypothetical protein
VLTSAIVDRTRGLRADLTRSALHLENAAAPSFQQGSWTYQVVQMFAQIGVDLQGDVASFPRHLADFEQNMSDPETVCFYLMKLTEEKTLSFFREMPDADCLASFRLFLSLRSTHEQNFFLLFFTSGLRWRFFTTSARGVHCPLCCSRFWSWEHFISCSLCPSRVSVPELVAMITLGRWLEIAKHAIRVSLIWCSLFCDSTLGVRRDDIENLFSS